MAGMRVTPGNPGMPDMSVTFGKTGIPTNPGMPGRPATSGMPGIPEMSECLGCLKYLQSRYA